MNHSYLHRALIAILLGGQMTFTSLVLAADPAAPEDAAAPEKDNATRETIPEIVVAADKLITPTKQATETVYTGSEITARGMEIQGARSATSVSGALHLLPGINVESADDNGLGAEMSNVRFRGVRGYLGALTVAGVPNYGGNPIGPRDYLYDMENMEALSVYKGAVPGDIGAGIGSRGGAMELKPDWPHEELGFASNRASAPMATPAPLSGWTPGPLPAPTSVFPAPSPAPILKNGATPAISAPGKMPISLLSNPSATASTSSCGSITMISTSTSTGP